MAVWRLSRRGAAQPNSANGNTPPGRGGFQSAAVRATPEGQDAIATVDPTAAVPIEGADAEEAFLVNGSTSGGLGAASDDEARRQRSAGRARWRPGGPGGGDPGLMQARWATAPAAPIPSACRLA